MKWKQKECSADNSCTKKYIFVSFSDTPWFGPWYVRQKLMTEFAKEHKVLYAGSRIDARLIWQKIRHGHLEFGIRLLSRNLLIINAPIMFPRIYRWKRVDQFIEMFYFLFIICLASIWGLNRIKVIYIWESKFAKMKKYFQNAVCVYHVYDAMNKYVYKSTKYKSQNIKRDSDEKYLVQKSHLFYAVSQKLCDYYENNFHRRPKLLINGVSEDYFDLSDPDCDQKARDILSPFPANRVCFFGSIIGVLDLDLIIESSRRLPEHHFIFLGDIRYQNSPDLDGKVDRLLAQQNVHHIGPFEPKLLPYLLNRMDIFLLLYGITEQIWTYYSSPAKLFEYMAMGKPIISTPHPFVQNYSDLVYIARNSGEFCNLIRSLSGNGYAGKKGHEMRDLAQKHLWSRKKVHVLNDLNEITTRHLPMTSNRFRRLL